MAINFPTSPEVDDTHTEGGSTWVWDGTAWNVQGAAPSAGNVYTTFDGDTGSATANSADDTLTLQGGTDIETSVAGDIVTFNFTGTGSQNVFETITGDVGSTTADATDDSLAILGGTGISTTADVKTVTINFAGALSDLSNVSATAPSSGQVLKWDGSQWAPGIDATTGGAGTDADTLDGFNGTYYLDYTNFTNTPSVQNFGTISVAGQNNIEADTDGDTLTLVAGTGIGITTSFTTDTITFTNTSPNITQNAFTAISVDDSTLVSADSDDSRFEIVGGSNIGVTADGNTITVAFTGSIDSGEANQNAFSNVAVSGQTTVDADSTTDTLTLVAGTNVTISTDAASNSVTINSTAAGGASQNVFETVTGDTGTTTADSTTDTLNILGGTNISTSVSGDSLTINYTGSTPPSNFDDLTDVGTAGTTIDQIAIPCMTMYEMDNTGTSAYLVPSHFTGNNPTVYAISGTTIAFDLNNIGGHPFEIQDPTADPYNTGLVHVATNGTVSSGSNAQGQSSGVLYWKIPYSISGNYRYQCQLHSGMVGAISIKSFNAI